jgi:hypothetical protein
MGTTRILAAVTLIAIVTAIIVVIVDPAFAQVTRPTPIIRGAHQSFSSDGIL